MNAPPQDPTPTPTDPGQDEQSPFDAILARIDSYIANPRLVTPQTLMDLRDEVESAKTDVDGEEQPEGETDANAMAPAAASPNSLVAKIRAVGGR